MRRVKSWKNTGATVIVVRKDDTELELRRVYILSQSHRLTGADINGNRRVIKMEDIEELQVIELGYIEVC